mgnify:FL=1
MRLPDWVLREIGALPDRFTGSVKINCFEGGVGNLTYEVSKKEPKNVANAK